MNNCVSMGDINKSIPYLVALVIESFMILFREEPNFALDSKRAIINCVVVDFVVSRFGQRDGCIFSFYPVYSDNQILLISY